jgi:protein-S-isoprenylcysteine O-methyltransferase Ste14
MILVVSLFMIMVFRQALEFSFKTRGPKARASDGHRSVLVWYITYLVNLGLAYWHLSTVTFNPVIGIGFLVLVGGVMLRTVAFRNLKNNYYVGITFRDNHELIDKGLYSYFRHPLHFGLFIEMLGLSLIVNSTLAWILAGLFFIALVQRNLIEEKQLLAQFGDDYVKYKKTSWDIIDLFGRL